MSRMANRIKPSSITQKRWLSIHWDEVGWPPPIATADSSCNSSRTTRLPAVEYQKSVEFGTADDKSCPYEPYPSMVGLYTSELHQYDKAWDVVHQALKSGT